MVHSRVLGVFHPGLEQGGALVAILDREYLLEGQAKLISLPVLRFWFLRISWSLALCLAESFPGFLSQSQRLFELCSNLMG